MSQTRSAISKQVFVCATGLLAASAAGAKTYYAPAPNGTDDTAALQAVLQKCVPGDARCAVQLAAGTYRTRQLYTYGFHGALVGQGQDVTIVEPITPLTVTVEFFADPTHSQCPCIVAFWDGADVRISDMTFRVLDQYPATPWDYGALVRWLKALVTVSGNARVDHVTFQAAPEPIDDLAFDRTADNGLMVINASDVTVSLTRSHMRHLGNGFEMAFLRRSNVMIGGTGDHGNVFDDTSGAGLFYDLDASTVEESYNRSSSAQSEWLALALFHFDDFTYDGVTRYYVHDNSIEIHGPPMLGIEAFDQFAPDTATMDVTIVDNNIVLNAGDTESVGIFVRTIGGLVANNQITGSGAIGIGAGRTRACTFEDNQLRRFSASVAPVWLGPFSTGCTIKTSDPSSVMDLGIGNTITRD